MTKIDFMELKEWYNYTSKKTKYFHIHIDFEKNTEYNLIIIGHEVQILLSPMNSPAGRDAYLTTGVDFAILIDVNG